MALQASLHSSAEVKEEASFRAKTHYIARLVVSSLAQGLSGGAVRCYYVPKLAANIIKGVSRCTAQIRKKKL